MKKNEIAARLRCGAAPVILAAALITPALAIAQDTPQEAQEAGVGDNVIIVTGSRIARPDLAARVRLWQMGPALLGAYRRELPQYNARLDPGAFQRALSLVHTPALVLSHSTWGRYGEGLRQRLGVYPDDPLAGALREKSALAALFVRHLEAWAQSGKPCSIMHDPLTVLCASMPDLVDLTDVELVVSDDGWASLGERACEDLRALAPERTGMIAACLSGPRAQSAGTTIAARMSLGIDDEAVRRGIVEALLGSEGAAVSSAWREHNRVRAE